MPGLNLPREPNGSAGPQGPYGSDGQPPSRLARRLGLGDAVVIGLGSMIGAGVFSAFGPAAAAAGSSSLALLAGLVLAGAVAYLNATSSARLAAVHPESGGAYAYGRRRLGDLWGFLAGWGFVVGKTASCAAMALTFGAYAAPGSARPAAVGAVVVVAVVTLLRVERTVRATRLLLALVLASLAVVAAGSLLGPLPTCRLRRPWAPCAPSASRGSCRPPASCSSPSPGTPALRRSAKRLRTRP